MAQNSVEKWKSPRLTACRSAGTPQRFFFSSRTFELPEGEPRSQLSVLPGLTTTRLLRLSGPQREAALSGGGFEVEQGVQRRPFVGFGLQWMHPRAA